MSKETWVEFEKLSDLSDEELVEKLIRAVWQSTHSVHMSAIIEKIKEEIVSRLKTSREAVAEQATEIKRLQQFLNPQAQEKGPTKKELKNEMEYQANPHVPSHNASIFGY